MNKLLCQSFVSAVFFGLYFFASALHTQAACVAPDNGGGTANVPEACVYSGEVAMHIIDGLPLGTTIDFIAPRLANHTNVVRNTTATGDEVVFETELVSLSLTGTGSLAGFNRVLSIPIAYTQVLNAPHALGPVQSFNSELQALLGQITGDPDFDLLRITGGSNMGLPSPGVTTLTQAGSNWNVDSFFDISYRIDFVGAPSGALSGMSGSTTQTTRFTATDSAVPLPAAGWLFITGLASLVGMASRRQRGISAV